MEDWIEKYLAATSGMASPEIFRLWAGISAVAGALERRCWVETNVGPPTFPNLYVMLVAPPAIGKTQAITPALNIMTQCTDLNIAPGSMTKAAVIDTLRDARRIVTLPGNTEILEYHSLQILVGELAVFVNSHDLEFLGVINEIFDNPTVFRERRRHVNGGREIQITHPQFNIICGAQPALLSSILPEEAWGLGTTARFIMIFTEEKVRPELFGTVINRKVSYEELAQHMQTWTSLYGKFHWEDAAAEVMRKYYRESDSGPIPVPDSPKLLHYNGRRVQFMIKLAMISAVSRASNLVIDEYDVERARFWLLTAEATMPGIFSSMSLKTDAQLLEEMHIWAWKEYRAKGLVPLHDSGLHEFLQHRVYSERIPKIIDIAKKSHLIEDLNYGMYKPSPRLDLGASILKGQ